MKYSIEHIGALLKKTRKEKKLSQRALSKKTHVPQSHISSIENGKVDLHVSSLIELSRALGMELMLVPQKLIPTVLALQQGKSRNTEEQVPRYRLEDEEGNE